MTRPFLRVAVMNVQSGVGTTRGFWQYLDLSRRRAARREARITRIGSALARANVSLAILLEVDGGSRRTGGLDQAARIADTSGLAGFSFFSCFRVADELNQGNAVHCSGGVEAVRNHRLPGLGEPRFLSEALVHWAGRTMHVFAAHVSLKAGVRREQLEEIRRITAARRRPVLLGGDFNTRKSEELDALSATLRRVPTGPTFPSWRPRFTLDHLFVSEHFRIVAARVASELREADHLPAIFDLELDPA